MKNKKGLIITGSIILVLIVGAVIIALFMRNKNEENYLEWKFESTYTGETIEGVRDREVVDAETFSGTLIWTFWMTFENEEGEELELKYVLLRHYENGGLIKRFMYIEEYKGTPAVSNNEFLEHMLSSYDVNTWTDFTNDPNVLSIADSIVPHLYREKSITDECESLTDLECYETYYTSSYETRTHLWDNQNIISDEFIEPKDVVVIN